MNGAGAGRIDITGPPSMNRTFVATFVLLVGTSLQAQEAIRFARSPDISPDGKSVAFSYLGDIWLVDVKGGRGDPSDHAREA